MTGRHALRSSKVMLVKNPCLREVVEESDFLLFIIELPGNFTHAFAVDLNFEVMQTGVVACGRDGSQRV